MKTEFNLTTEREKWFSKWLRKRLTGRAIVELKQIDKKFIDRLKKFIEFKVGFPNSEEYHKLLNKIDELTGGK